MQPHASERVPKERVRDRLLPLTKIYYEEFHLCSDCGQIYWQGSHHKRMQQLVERVRASKNDRSLSETV